MRMKMVRVLVLAAALAVCAGCRGAPPAPVAERAPEPAETTDTSLQIEESTVKVVDPGGRWTFEAESERMEAASVHGPYTLTPARARYEEVGRPEVLMSAKKGQIDQETRRVVFEGQVRISSGGWMVEADRAEYELDSGEVVVTGNTKWTFVDGGGGSGESQSADEDDSP